MREGNVLVFSSLAFRRGTNAERRGWHSLATSQVLIPKMKELRLDGAYRYTEMVCD